MKEDDMAAEMKEDDTIFPKHFLQDLKEVLIFFSKITIKNEMIELNDILIQIIQICENVMKRKNFSTIIHKKNILFQIQDYPQWMRL